MKKIYFVITALLFAGFALVTGCDTGVGAGKKNPAANQQKFTITVNASANGKVIPNKSQAVKGEIVTLKIEPENGYELASLNVIGTTVVTIVNAKTQTFPMPASDVTIESFYRIDPWEGNYVLYSNGVFHPNVDLQWPADPKNFEATDGNGRNGHTKTFKGDAYNLFSYPGKQINLSTITGVSFWIRSNNNDAYLEQAGLGRDRASSNNNYRIEMRNTTFGTEWQRVIIPMPKLRAVLVDELFYVWGGRGGDMWIDDIEFLTAPITDVKIIIPEFEGPINAYPTSTIASSLLKGVKFEYTFEGITEKGYLYNGFRFEPWGVAYSYDVTGDIARQGNYIVPKAGGKSFTLSVNLDNASNSRKGSIAALQDWMFGDIENTNRDPGYWYWGAWWSGAGFSDRPDQNNKKYAMITGVSQQWHGFGRYGQNWDLSPFSKISFFFSVQFITENQLRDQFRNAGREAQFESELAALKANGTYPWHSKYRFGLEIGGRLPPDGNGTLYVSPDFSWDVANNTWEKVTFNISQFTEDNGTTPLTSVGLSAITGFRLICSDFKAPRIIEQEGEWPALAEITAVVQ